MIAHRKPSFEVIDGGVGDEARFVFSLADYIQMASMGKRSVVVSVQEPQLHGEIVIRDGLAWFARDDDGEGEDAFRRLVIGGSLQRDVPVRCRPLGVGVVPRNIHSSLESLMLDTAREYDEHTADLAADAELDIDIDVEAPSSADAHFEAFFDEGVEALLRKDYDEALVAFSAAYQLRPDNPTVQANLQRLHDLGYRDDEGESS